VGWPGNEAVHLDLGMGLYILTWEWGCTSWPGNGAVHLDLGMGLYILWLILEQSEAVTAVKWVCDPLCMPSKRCQLAV